MFVVGIGASAGGLEAITKMLSSMTRHKEAVCYVLIQHLSPDKKSYMQDILQDRISLDVTIIEAGMTPRPNTFYLSPPGSTVRLHNDRFLLEPIPTEHSPNRAIDKFFTSLALNSADKAVGVILSGSGNDGSEGCQEIYSHGGAVFVQQPEEAEFQSMPRAVLGTGSYDRIAPAEELAQAIFDYLSQNIAGMTDHKLVEEIRQELGSFTPFILDSTNVSLDDYKEATVCRRIARRMQELNSKNVAHYLQTLAAETEERAALLSEILIGVSRFFRDPEFFDAVDNNFQELLDSHPDVIRIWVAGCSRGQEVYSLLMQLYEQTSSSTAPPRIVLFATDINPHQIEIASRGIYREVEMEGVSEQRREKFFEPLGDGRYQIKKNIRESVVFSAHNVIDSPPFSRIDFVSCRNLLIYLTPNAQQRALYNLTYALKLGGTLALGSSESVAETGRYFSVINNHWRLYKKTQQPQSRRQNQWTSNAGLGETTRHALATQPVSDRHTVTSDVFIHLIEKVYPDSILVDQDMNLMAIFGQGSLLLNREISGVITTSVNSMFNNKIGVPIMTALESVHREQKEHVYEGIELGDGSVKDLVINSFTTESGDIYVCNLVDSELSEPAIRQSLSSEDSVVAMLRQELGTTKRALEQNIRDLEVSNEELQTTNEELIASNEELQSTNEELNSVNEELYTLNNELQAKIDEVILANTDFENLIRSTEIGVLFVNEDFVIRSVSESVTRHFSVRRADVGRSIFELEFGTTLRRVRNQMHRGTPETRVIVDLLSDSGRYFQCTTMVYTNETGERNGYVMTLVDVTESKQNEVFLQEAEHDGKLGGWVLDLEHNDMQWSKQLYEICNLPDGTSIDLERFLAQFTRSSAKEMRQRLEACGRGTDFIEEFELAASGNQSLWVRASGRAVRDKDNEIVRVRGTMQDISIEKFNRDRQELAIRTGQIGIWELNPQSSELKWNSQMFEIYGKEQTGEKLYYEDWQACIHAEDVAKTDKEFQQSLEGGTFNTEFRVVRSSGEVRYVKATAEIYYNEFKLPIRVIGINFDVTELRRQEQEVLSERTKRLQDSRMAAVGELAANIGHEINNPLAIAVGNMEIVREKLAERGVMDATIDEYFKRHEASAYRIRNIVDGLRTVSRDESEEELVRVSMNQLVSTVAGLLTEIYARQGVELSVNNPTQEAYVMGHFGELQQVLMNLLSNAKDAVAYSAIKKIELISELSGEKEFSLIVRDSGSGIDAEHMDNVFSEFFTTKPTGKGTGLGLSIVKRIAEAHKGHVNVTSEPGKTEFRVVLPLESSETKTSAPKASMVQGEDYSLLAHKNIVVVDDEPGILTFLEAILKSADMEVRTASGQTEALRLIEEKPPEMIITDLRMADGNGISLIKEAKSKLGDSFPCFVITGGPTGELLEQEDELAKLENVINKPFTRSTLMSALVSGLSHG